MHSGHRILVAALCAGKLFSQTTQIDLRLQSKNIDFTAANATKPFKTGTTLPASCSVGEIFYKLDAPAGSNLYACTTLNAWTLEQGAGGGGGASMASQLGDFLVARTNTSTLTIGANCAPSTPCSARIGNQVYSFAAGGTVSITAGSGIALVYVSAAGALTVGHNVTASCSAGCTAQSGITAFPPDAIPLFTWSASSGAWDLNGGVDLRAVLSSKAVLPGVGLTSAEASGKTTLSADAALIALRTSVPGSSSSTCTAGYWAMDANFYYVCVAVNDWRRVALSSW
jgi:hypothetical protein